ncbi:Aste57867_25507 [Aphanomyces stellatus]|uniref:Aste57867_25507 protein n=1 Tax=Aphanomyces stellatus TaxID=120398 RepID=A0A485LTG9_9STRA|nr:hypothetical protein As57867_025428 [Aphanomyces stellatus]VFU02130.1 Aste57867_25507 [Aphanomyces stellatus]
MEFSGPLNAVSVSQSQKLIAVGGRDVLKIVTLESTGFVEKRNLRSSKSNLNFSTNDIRWHPQSDSMLATAATNGFLVLWDVPRDSSKMHKREFKAHERAVNRICWHPTDFNSLLSASQDGLIKHWDPRLKGRNVNTFQQQKSESVRDVKFSLFDDTKFAAAFENGTVEIWDLRNNKQPETKFTAHQGHILSLDWHPKLPNVIATGSRDRSVKIWDLNDAFKPLQTIALIANAGRIQWRPNCPDHIATSSSITDSRINVWDTQRPFVPLACMQGHGDIVSDFQWFDTPQTQQPFSSSDASAEVDGCDFWQHVIACSKDKTLKLHSLADAMKPHQSMHTVALTMNMSGQMVSSHDVIEKNKKHAEYISIMDALSKLEEEYQSLRYRVATEQDKKVKHELLNECKHKRDEESAPLKLCLKELGADEMPLKVQSKLSISTEKYKTTMSKIKQYWSEKNTMTDPLIANLEIGKLLKSIGEEDKAIVHIKKAIEPHKRKKNLIIGSSNEDWNRIKQIEHKRMYEAHYILFHYYLKKEDYKNCRTHMSAYLALSEGENRVKALKYLESTLFKHCGVQEIGETNKHKISEYILITRSLGSLSDLRLEILNELNGLFPNDPYILESLGLLYVRLNDFPKAKNVLDNYVKLPDVSELPLFAEMLEFKPSFSYSN